MKPRSRTLTPAFDPHSIDPAEWVAICYRDYREDLEAYAAARLGPADASDVVQEVFATLVAFVEAQGVGAVAQPRAWLYCAVRNRITNHQRMASTHRRLEEDVARLCYEPPATTEETLLDEERRRAVQDELRALPDADRHAVCAWARLGAREVSPRRLRGIAKRAILRLGRRLSNV
jgi:RNA polymerase sigma factor (sigma-70 family)